MTDPQNVGLQISVGENMASDLLRTLVERTPVPHVHQATPRFAEPLIPPASPPVPLQFPVRTLDAEASALLGARVYRLEGEVTVQWDRGWTDADQERAEALLGRCQMVGEYKQTERSLDLDLTAKLKAGGLLFCRVSSIGGLDPVVVWTRDPSPAQQQLARDLLS
jgi:hypothetical protein